MIPRRALVAWVNHFPKERLTKPQLHAVSEELAGIILILNTTGYSRRKDDGWYVRDAGANLLELGRRIRVVRKINRWRQEFFVSLVAVELRRLRINLLSDTGRLAFLKSLFPA